MNRLFITAVVLLAALTAPGAATAQDASHPDGEVSVALFLDGKPFVRGRFIPDSDTQRGDPDDFGLYVPVAELQRCCIAERVQVDGSKLLVIAGAEDAIAREGDESGVRLHAARDVQISSELRFVGRDAYVPFADLARALGATALEPADNLLALAARLHGIERAEDFSEPSDDFLAIIGKLDVEIETREEFEWSWGLERDSAAAMNIRTGARCALCSGPADARGGR